MCIRDSSGAGANVQPAASGTLALHLAHGLALRCGRREHSGCAPCRRAPRRPRLPPSGPPQ
eukprot:2168602-Rhodomonas_salina.1